jgi:ankyrin repeat protein
MERLRTQYQVDISRNQQTSENAILSASQRSSRSGAETSIAFYQYLQELGLDPTIVSADGNTVLHHLAYRSKKAENLKYFIDLGVDVNQVNDEGNTALINAAAGKELDMIQLLVAHTDDLNHQNQEGISAFTRALKYNDLSIVRYLEAQGADTKVVDAEGRNLLYHLVDACRGDMDPFKQKFAYLQNRGHDPLALQEDGSTLLHAAIHKQDQALIQYLIEQGIAINAVDAEGHTILHYAAMQSEDAHLLKYLVSAGADKNITTEFEETVYELAQANELLTKNAANIDFLRVDSE